MAANVRLGLFCSRSSSEQAFLEEGKLLGEFDMVLNQMSTSGSSFQLYVFGLGLLCINWYSAVYENMSRGVSIHANFRGGAYGPFVIGVD